MISDVLISGLLLGLLVLGLTAALSPLETLSWWAGWTEQELGDTAPPPADGADRRERYVVYLSGVASISGQFLLPREKAFIRKLEKRLPGVSILSDVFPYSPSGQPLLASPRLFEQLWRRIQFLRLHGRGKFLYRLINFRNIFQVMVSADHRYGPIFNQGAASVIEAALLDNGYRRGSNAPVIIIGYSGGAQVAVGAAPFLAARLGAPIDIISVGGVLASDPGLNYVRKLHHIVGSQDSVERFGAVMFPDRWKAAAYSDWNAARREGRIDIHPIEGMNHTGINGYFGRLPGKDGGPSNTERMLDVVAGMIET